MVVQLSATLQRRPGGMLDRIRRPKPVEAVEVKLTGHPRAVAAVARALAEITIVDSMRHQPASRDDQITMECIARPTHRIRVP